ncbi:MAG: hypothetical protein EAX96_03985 [Candidatus Lokiarchaeota archaeon]|nr:hypothetical protein [Candidatus Lokiarchaeota archaeon]
MRYDENYLSENQEKKVKKVLKAVQDYYKWDDIPDCSVLGLNPDEEIEKLTPILNKLSELYEQETDKKKKKEFKKKYKEVKQTQTSLKNEADYRIKIVLPFKDVLKQMTIMSEWRKTEFLGSSYYSYTCLLDLVIESPVIFGRKARKKMHGFGNFFFAPIQFNLPELDKKIDDAIVDDKSDEFLLTLTRANPMIEMLDRICMSKEACEQMRIMNQMEKDGELTGINIVDQLNHNSDLVKKMKKICHFGHYNAGIIKNVSEIDVSTLCLPLKRGTILYLIDYEDKHKNSLQAIDTLKDALIHLGG